MSTPRYQQKGKVGAERSVRFGGEAKEITLEAWLKIEEGGGGR